MEMSDKKEKEDELILLRKKVENYFKENVPVHITFKKEGEWENGYIVSNPTADFFKLEYLQQGKEKHKRDGDFIFFMEIKNIEAFSEVGK